MKMYWKEYLSYSRRDRRGIFILLVIIFTQITFLFSMDYFTVEKYQEAEERYRFSAVPADKPETDKFFPAAKNTTPIISLSSGDFFDPNGLPDSEWKKLGVPPKIIRTIKNYESKGGCFYKKEDLKKLYGITEELYAALESHIVIISNKKHQTKNYKPETSDRKRQKINLNTSDSTTLLSLSGIGPVFAARIIKYRNLLGGYYSVDQLKEVYGIDSLLFIKVQPQVYADSIVIQKININAAAMDDLKKHPYIKYKIAKEIIQYRNQHGSFSAVSELRNFPLINDDLYRKLAHYLSIE